MTIFKFQSKKSKKSFTFIYENTVFKKNGKVFCFHINQSYSCHKTKKRTSIDYFAVQRKSD